MKKIIVTLLVFLMISTKAQQVGDTIVVKAFKYGSTTRDTLIQFPNNSLTYEKILMKYNMRCKNAQISNSGSPNLGCGQWDYSCNSYIADSSKVEKELNLQPNYVVSNFAGTTFSYVSQPTYDYYNYSQTNVSYSITSESQYTISTGNVTTPNFLKANEKSGKSQVLYTAAELSLAGFTAGNINGILLNVANAGGTVNFFKVSMQHATLTALNSGSVVTTGFTNVFNSNYTFINGNNKIMFYTPFVWDGTSNVIIEYSFTNSVPNTAIVFSGANTASITGLYANNNYALDLSNNGHAIINTALMASINTEITVSFWAYGNATMLPANTSILFGTPTNTTIQGFNIHLPWSDSKVYFDCGNAGSNYDRISKVAGANNQGGQWNHWAFTKNANTGDMIIYLNGNLWLFNTGKINTISIINLILGKSNTLTNNYKGKINELTIWDKELSLTDIQTWMNKPITNVHPFYSNLVAYYKMNEGGGLTINDFKNSLTAPCTNVLWTFDRGHTLNRMFTETTTRPNIVFLRGSYAFTTTTVTVKDSIQHLANTIQNYSVTSNASVTPMANDAVNLVSTANGYQAVSNIYNGDTGILTGTTAIASTSVITISNLNYYKRYPYYNEIMSFVTPYGIGLDFGAKGKSWYYDVSDFAPILKGPKRFLMSLGGEYQEQMDIEFWFIVGTPPHTVLEFNQLWQGAVRQGQAGIASINNDTRFEPLNVPLLSNAQAFKVRSTITGHGSEGEFGQNGGNVNHYFNVNGGANEFAWQITQTCASNPIIAQGGTWIYPRQGWCPGQASLLKQNDITPYVTPGATVTLDYNCSNPQVAAGDYRYIAAHQLISYGGANFTTDASLKDVLMPSNKVVYSKFNPICSNPIILIQNTGSSNLTNLQIDYWLNNSSIKQTYNWTGNLAFMDTTRVVLPIATLWQSGVQTTNNSFNVELKTANTITDQYLYNNKYNSPFILPDVVTGSVTVEFKTNNNPTENTYKIVDDNGNIVAGASALTTANTIYADSYVLNGCYKLIVEDTGEDGVQWWANTSQGIGFVRLKDASGTILKTFQPDFGNRFEYSFTTPTTLAIKENELAASINVYPNPAHNKFKLTGNDIENITITIADVLGKTIELPFYKDKNSVEFDCKLLKAGIYLISITKNNQTATKKIVIY